jgi:cytochrome P450
LLPFLNTCICEALHIDTPISYVIPCMSAADAQLGCYAIPAGTSLTVNIYMIHHTKGVWADPHMFCPEHFLEEAHLKMKSWVLFALGPWQCPACSFAVYEQHALAAVLLQDYEWELPTGLKHAEKIQKVFSPFALTVPHELELAFRRI